MDDLKGKRVISLPGRVSYSGRYVLILGGAAREGRVFLCEFVCVAGAGGGYAVCEWP